MTRDAALLTKPVADLDGAATRRPASLPPALLDQAVRRLRGVSLAVVGLVAFGWLVPVTLMGRLGRELSLLYEWLPPTTAIVASFGMYLLTRNDRLGTTTILRLGLSYEVIVAWAMAFSQYWQTFQDVPASAMTFDRVGTTTVGIWMILFTILVPAPPRHALGALIVSGCAIPVVYSLSVAAGGAPALPFGDFLYVLVLPYALSAGVAYAAARVLYRLGADLKRATEMGSYRLESLIGRGGMGEVWRASHRMLARPAAVKLIRLDTADSDPEKSSGLARRFEREAQATAALASHHTVELFDYGITDDGTCYYVMELLDGVDLETLVEKHGPLPAARAVYLLRQVCHSLADAHSRGLIHRDIKPANIFVCTKGLDHDFVKVLDFGLVALQSSPREETRLTADGIVAGTPAYLPPEMAAGGDVDTRADLYALGCVAYWLLTGRLVFEADTAVAMIVAHASQEPDRPSTVTEQDIPPALEEVVLDCLAKSPERRPQSAREVEQRLGAIDIDDAWDGDRAARWWELHKEGTAE